MKFTEEQIIKAMQCVIGNGVSCSECEYHKALPFPSCRRMCAEQALDLINRRAAETERLALELDISKALHKEAVAERNFYCHQMIRFESMFKTAKSNAIKEFAERVKKGLGFGHFIRAEDIDNLVTEMMEEEK